MARFDSLQDLAARDDGHRIAVQPPGAGLPPRRLLISRLLAGLARRSELPGAATAATPGLASPSNAAPLGPRAGGGAAGSDSLYSREDHRHPLPTGAQLEAVLDAYFGGTTWRTAHTALRTAVQTRDLLDGLLGTGWRTGGGGTGISLDQALDGVGAALAMLPQFSYDAAANTFRFVQSPDNVARAEAARALAGLDGKANTADLPAAVSAAVGAALPPFLTITPIPAGIAGGNNAADYPDAIDVVFSERLTDRTITGVTMTLAGSPLALAAATPISALDAANELQALLRFNIGGAAKTNIATVVQRHGRLYASGQITITFGDGSSHSHDFAWPVNLPALAPPHIPARFATAIGASPAVLPAGTYDVSIRVRRSSEIGYKRVPIEDLTAGAQSIIVRLNGGNVVGVSLSYTASSRTLTHSRASGTGSQGNYWLRAIGEA